MSDPIAPAPETPAPRTRGFFNKAQLADIQTVEDIYIAATAADRATALAGEDIDAPLLTLFDGKLQSARDKIGATGQDAIDKKNTTLAATGAERTLVVALQGIQSAAKQRQRLEAMDGDPATNFKAEGYLINTRLNASRAGLLQAAATLIAKAKAEPLPGHKAPKIAEIESKLAAYRDSETAQTETGEESGEERIARDKLVADINNLRSAIQHAADRLYPYSEEENHPTRRTFHLPLDRALGV